ncbi:sugar kinase, partial [Streptomyces sp. SID7982]|nr:sugar kinase [Streptomyces sp. SID7982]
DDHYGEYCWDALEQGEGIDLSMSHTVPGWHSPVTVSMAYEGERTMVSHGHEAPAPAPGAGTGSRAGAAWTGTSTGTAETGTSTAAAAPAFPQCPPRARAAIASLAPGRSEPWVATAARDGALVFGDV